MRVLVPKTEAEYLAYFEASIRSYAADKVTNGQWAPRQSLELARKSFDELLPRGLATPGHHIFNIISPDGMAVGALWYGEQDQAGKRIAYVYDVVVTAGHQRQGHATRAFVALEEEVAALGLSGIALHVFGHNTGAQALYAKLGYRPTNINLFKPVHRAGA